MPNKDTTNKGKQQEFLDMLKTIREGKDIDQMQELILSIFTMYGLTTDEVAALLFSIMKSVLQEKSNREMLANKFSIDIDRLGAEGVLQVQRALLAAYLEKVKQ